MKIFIDTSNYKDGKYLEIIHQIPTKKRKSYILIQNLIKNIKNDDRILTNDMIEKILKYYEIYMMFSYTTKIKISNIKLLYMLTRYLNLDYKIYSNIINSDIQKFILFENFIKEYEKIKNKNKIPKDFGWKKNI